VYGSWYSSSCNFFFEQRKGELRNDKRGGLLHLIVVACNVAGEEIGVFGMVVAPDK
jgi:hypothetical protein